MNQHGLLTCARYAFPPNSLHYCGPEKQNDLKGYQKENIVDRGLSEILIDFQTLYPYLKLIANENEIADPFDPRVVEAYWIGNSLLNNVSMKNLHIHFNETMGFRKKMKKKDLELLYGKLPTGLLPHHTFHVLNIFTRTGHQGLEHTLETMDACRISWGKIIRTSNVERRTSKLLIETRPLVLEKGELTLGNSITKEINVPIRTSNIEHRTSLVSFHWDTFCEIITPKQASMLEFFTLQAVHLANTTL
jgi:hypothetical protein